MSSLNDALPLRQNITIQDEITAREVAPLMAPLGASQDARQLVRLIQCSQCSYPLREPVTLPCGNSLCKRCIPELHLRTNISYPATSNRLQGFTCPFPDCKKEHAEGDCRVDVALNKVMEIVQREVEDFRLTDMASEALLRVEEKDRWAIAGITSLRDEEPHTRTLPGGRLTATYTMSEMGELAYDSEVIFTNLPTVSDLEVLDATVLDRLKEASRSELDCQVCYALFLDPLTTTCGHTFCRKCLHRVLDHSNLCPICRRALSLPPTITSNQAPSNIILTKLISGLWPEALASREEAAKGEEQGGEGELDTPLFVCTLSFPTMPTFLHIFEPRYRLMIRRAMESESRTFGMLLHNPRREPQGELGPVGFYQYGTLLQIVSVQMMPDGRSLIETVGVSRFRVLNHGSRDGYTVGKIERVDDISIATEEAFEARETTAASSNGNSAQDHIPPQGRRRSLLELNTMSTQELMELGVNFVHKMRNQSAPWLHSRVFQAYGEMPESDAALFPWWFASVLPIVDSEKYRLLGTTSVRDRLKICAGWIMRIEAQRWSSNSSSCTVV